MVPDDYDLVFDMARNNTHGVPDGDDLVVNYEIPRQPDDTETEGYAHHRSQRVSYGSCHRV